MMGTSRSRNRHLPVLAIGLLGCTCTFAADSDNAGGGKSDKPPFTLKLVKGTEGVNAGKPAEIFFDREDDQSHTITNAAVLLRDVTIASTPGFMETWWGLSAGIGKDTLAKKRSDKLSLGTGVYSTWNLSADKKDALGTSAEVFFENDREHGARGQAFLLDATLRTPRLYRDPNIGTGETSFDLTLVPSVGVYGRHISSTDDAAVAPVGHHGGIYLGAQLSSRLWYATGDKKNPLFDRLSLQVTAVLTRDTSASQGYSKATYRYADVSFEYLLYGEAAGKGWKPTLSVGRTRGTNRPANEDHKNTSSIGLKVSYGI